VAGTGLRFQARFAHLGYRLDKPVASIWWKTAAPSKSPMTRQCSTTAVPPGRTQSAGRLGFGGFRLHFHTDWTRDVVAFQALRTFARSARSAVRLVGARLALGTGQSNNEEFPQFIAYYLERPAPESNRITLYALLDSPSVAGAYRS